jgi:hypothetical protein
MIQSGGPSRRDEPSREKAQAAFARRDEQRAHREAMALRRRCEQAKHAASRSLRQARVSLDKAYLAARRVDDEDADDDDMIELDHAVALVVAAVRRCEHATRRAVGAAGKFDARQAERYAQEAAREDLAAGRGAQRVDQLARNAEAA